MKTLSHFESHTTETTLLSSVCGIAMIFILGLASTAESREKPMQTLRKPRPVSMSSGKGLVSCIRQVSPSDEVAEDSNFGDVHILEDRACPKKPISS